MMSPDFIFTRPADAKAVTIVFAVAEAIRELRELPSGTLYSQLCGQLSFDSYTAIIRTLIGAGLIEQTPGHLLRWIGPELAK